MASLTQVAGQLKTNNEENMAGHERVSSSVEKLTGSVNKLLGIMKQSQLDMIEAKNRFIKLNADENRN